MGGLGEDTNFNDSSSVFVFYIMRLLYNILSDDFLKELNSILNSIPFILETIKKKPKRLSNLPRSHNLRSKVCHAIDFEFHCASHGELVLIQDRHPDLVVTRDWK